MEKILLLTGGVIAVLQGVLCWGARPAFQRVPANKGFTSWASIF